MFNALASSLLVFLCRLLTGVRARWLSPAHTGQARIYYANHSSHLDSLVVWSSIPAHLRGEIHPVAAADYWAKTTLRRYLAQHIFKAVLIHRETANSSEDSSTISRSNPLDQLQPILDQQHALILFPEGTRNCGEKIQNFKSGLWHLAKKNPHVELVPVYLENLNRVLPKGSRLVVPIICSATFGPPLHFDPNETRLAFLERTKKALEELAS